METKLKLFNEKTVRTVWNADEEEWYFSVVDVVAILTDSVDPKQYIKKILFKLSWTHYQILMRLEMSFFAFVNGH